MILIDLWTKYRKCKHKSNFEQEILIIIESTNDYKAAKEFERIMIQISIESEDESEHELFEYDSQYAQDWNQYEPVLATE